MSREAILERVRTALGRKPGDVPAPPPPVYLSQVHTTLEQRVALFTAALEALAGRLIRCPSRHCAGDAVNEIIAGKRVIASRASYLRECGIEPEWTECSRADVGITSADYALADTGTLVLFSGAEESRLVSLLPPRHIAILPLSRLIDSQDDLLARVPLPADATSSMVFITGPSRTADIEQILVRGVHGPGEITVVLVDE